MDTQELVEMWSHYQNVVLHYSDITFQFRVAFIGSLSFLAGLIIYLFPFRGVEKELDRRLRDLNLSRARMFVSVIAVLLFVAGYIVDMQYYSKLLHSATNAVLTFEMQYSHLDFNLRVACGLTNDFESCMELSAVGTSQSFTGETINILYRCGIGVAVVIFIAFAWGYFKSTKEFDKFCSEEEKRLDEEEKRLDEELKRLQKEVEQLKNTD